MLRGSRDKRQEFERLIREVFPSLYGAARRFAVDEETAKDLTQEAILRGFQAYDKFDGKNFKAWILTILTNLYINDYRRKKREPEVLSIDSEDWLAETIVSTDDVEDEVLQDVLSEDVELALSRLPVEFRTAVVLSDIEDMSYQEIAEAMGVPIGTVRSRIARGREMLRKLLYDFALKKGYLRRGDAK
jgi:RNA polymerase sigma-70 factor (ECF subfamily)